jgi:NSS family neurotransmitter:Na+ symporter
VVAAGIEKGIERCSKIMMPMLLLIIFILMGFSLNMPNAAEGIQFMLKPDFSKVTKDVVLSAMGQAFFTLSVGMGTLATYASYFKKETKLIPSALGVCTIDTIVAISAGFIIFPAVFSVGDKLLLTTLATPSLLLGSNTKTTGSWPWVCERRVETQSLLMSITPPLIV